MFFEQTVVSPLFQPLMQREEKRVKRHVDRARAKGREATLTIEQWLATLQHHEWSCIYCNHAGAEVLDHIVPVVMDGGTTAVNCVPCCKACHHKRMALFQQMERVQSEMAQLA